MSSGDRVRALIRGIALAVVEPLIRLRTAYPCEVLRQNDDGTVDLRPDDATMPTITGRPIRGLPGVSVKVRPGARALLVFEGGDAGRAVCTLFDPSSLAELRITASTRVVLDAPEVDLTPDASRGVCSEGDFGTFTGTSPTAGVVTGTFQIATGSARVRL